MNQHPFRALVELAEQRASGEFVCVAKSSEMHVFLQSGRVAWATDSSSPFAFSRWLLEHTALTKEVYQEVLESCRRDRLPLGETLVEWRVATRDEIKSALRYQIRGALACLEDCDEGRTIFLERTHEFSSYDARLTFVLDDLVAPPPRASAVVHGNGLLDQLAAEVPEATWFELLEGNLTIGQLPSAPAPRVQHAFAVSSVMDGAELLAFRSARGTMLGVALSSSRSVWCRLDPEVAFAGALTTICSAAAVDIKTTPPIGFDPSDVRVRSLQVSGKSESLEAFLSQAPEVLGAMLAEQGEVVASALRRPWEPRVVASLVQRRAPLLEANLPSSSQPPQTMPPEELGTRRRTLVSAERNLWCFGAELGSHGRQTLWLFLDRVTAQGLGWAYLSTLSRQITSLYAEPKGWTKTA